MNSQTTENYLKAIFNLVNENEEVGISEIAQHLAVSIPTVNSMVKKLAELEYLNYEKYKPLKITQKGKVAAALVIRKHRLTEMYLVEKMGFGWEEVHAIAEQIEHIKSSAFFERMDELLGYPNQDPHGSPIPDRDGNIVNLSLRKLADCEVGEEVTIKGLNHSSDDFLHFLNSKSLTLNTKLKIVSIESFDKNMLVSYANHPHEVFSVMVCEKLLVE